MHVKISKEGRKVINNKELASNVVLAVVNNKNLLERGKVVQVNNSNKGVKFATTVKELKHSF